MKYHEIRDAALVALNGSPSRPTSIAVSPPHYRECQAQFDYQHVRDGALCRTIEKPPRLVLWGYPLVVGGAGVELVFE